MFSFPQEKTVFETVTKWQKRKCGTQQSKMAAVSRVCVLLPLLEYRVRRSLKQRQAALYNPIDEVNDFLTTVLVIGMESVLDRSVIDFSFFDKSVLNISLFNCVGFSCVGESNIGFSNVGCTKVGLSNVGFSHVGLGGFSCGRS